MGTPALVPEAVGGHDIIGRLSVRRQERRDRRLCPTNLTWPYSPNSVPSVSCGHRRCAVTERLLLWDIGIHGLVALLVTVSACVVAAWGSVRLALAAVLRRVGTPVYRWLTRGGRDDR